MIPSRQSNPFATCWTRPGAMPFRYPVGQSGAGLVARLAAHGWWGEIIGPHGSGKSTLLATLVPLLEATGRRLRFGAKPQAAHDVVLVDGYEQLGWFAQRQLRRQCRWCRAGLLITSHAPTGLPTMIELRPRAELIEQLVAELAARIPTPIAQADVVASVARHGSNVRQVLFDLYVLHEQLVRTSRTAGPSAA